MRPQKQDALHMLDEPVPLVIRNAPTRLMGELGYGEGYVYAHDTEEKIAAMECLPESLRGRRYYLPGEAGSEARAISRSWRPCCAGVRRTRPAQRRSRKAKKKAGMGAARNPAQRRSRKAKKKAGRGAARLGRNRRQVTPGPPGVPPYARWAAKPPRYPRACPRSGRPLRACAPALHRLARKAKRRLCKKALDARVGPGPPGAEKTGNVRPAV